MKAQDRTVEVKEELKGKELIGKTCLVPLIDKEVLILPATFVDPDNATGVVSCVPAHAPYDHIALTDLRNNVRELEKYGLTVDDVKSIQYVSLIKVSGYGDYPTVEECEKLGIKTQNENFGKIPYPMLSILLYLLLLSSVFSLGSFLPPLDIFTPTEKISSGSN